MWRFGFGASRNLIDNTIPRISKKSQFFSVSTTTNYVLIDIVLVVYCTEQHLTGQSYIIYILVFLYDCTQVRRAQAILARLRTCGRGGVSGSACVSRAARRVDADAGLLDAVQRDLPDVHTGGDRFRNSALAHDPVVRAARHKERRRPIAARARPPRSSRTARVRARTPRETTLAFRQAEDRLSRSFLSICSLCCLYAEFGYDHLISPQLQPQNLFNCHLF